MVGDLVKEMLEHPMDEEICIKSCLDNLFRGMTWIKHRNGSTDKCFCNVNEQMVRETLDNDEYNTCFF